MPTLVETIRIGIDRDLWQRAGPLFDELVDASERVRSERLAEVRRTDAQAADEVATLLDGKVAADAIGFLDGIVNPPRQRSTCARFSTSSRAD